MCFCVSASCATAGGACTPFRTASKSLQSFPAASQPTACPGRLDHRPEHIVSGFHPLLPRSSGQKGEPPRARSHSHAPMHGHGPWRHKPQPTRSTRHTRKTPNVRLWHLCCHRKKETLTGRPLPAQTHTHKKAHAPPARAASLPIPPPPVPAPRDYYPSPIGHRPYRINSNLGRSLPRHAPTAAWGVFSRSLHSPPYSEGRSSPSAATYNMSSCVITVPPIC